jgi:hypothetical protein
MLIQLLAPLIGSNRILIIVTSPSLARQVEHEIREALPTLPAVGIELAGDHCYHGKSMVVAIRFPKSLLTEAEDLGENIRVMNVIQTLSLGEMKKETCFLLLWFSFYLPPLTSYIASPTCYIQPKIRVQQLGGPCTS